MHITFRVLDTAEVGRAHAWHSGFAASNDSLYPRTKATFADMVLDRQCWCAITDDDEILGLSYCYVEDHQREVEIGGLMVAAKARNQGIGDYLFRLPLIQFLVNEQPQGWSPVPTIVAHVIKGNEKPRGLIARTGFEFAKPVKIPGEKLPGLRTEDDGFVYGDEYHLPLPGSLDTLASWLEGEKGKLRDDTPCSVRLLEGESLTLWAEALRSMAADQEGSGSAAMLRSPPAG